MSRQVSALVVNEDVNLLQDLVAILECQEVATQCARSARKRKRRCRSKGSPDIIIFAGTSFADGTWRDVLDMAPQGQSPDRSYRNHETSGRALLP